MDRYGIALNKQSTASANPIDSPLSTEPDTRFVPDKGYLYRIGFIHSGNKDMFVGAKVHFQGFSFLCKSDKSTKAECCSWNYINKNPRGRLAVSVIIYAAIKIDLEEYEVYRCEDYLGWCATHDFKVRFPWRRFPKIIPSAPFNVRTWVFSENFYVDLKRSLRASKNPDTTDIFAVCDNDFHQCSIVKTAESLWDKPSFPSGEILNLSNTFKSFRQEALGKDLTREQIRNYLTSCGITP